MIRIKCLENAPGPCCSTGASQLYVVMNVPAVIHFKEYDIWERINIGIYLPWISVLAIVLLPRENEKGNKISIS